MDLGTGIAVAGISISLLGGFKIAWPTLAERKKTVEDKREDIEYERRGTCPAHRDLVEGLADFRREITSQFQTLNKYIMDLCKEVGNSR